MKTTNYGDWTITTRQINDPDFGKGWYAIAYIKKTNGTKDRIRIFQCFDIKTGSAMVEYVKSVLTGNKE